MNITGKIQPKPVRAVWGEKPGLSISIGASIAAHVGMGTLLATSSEVVMAVAAASTVILAPALALLIGSYRIIHSISESKANMAARLAKAPDWFKVQQNNLIHFSRRALYRGKTAPNWFDFIVKAERLSESRTIEEYCDSTERLKTMFGVMLDILKEKTASAPDPLTTFQQIYDYIENKYEYRSGRALLRDDLAEKSRVTKWFGENLRVWRKFFLNPDDRFLSFAPNAASLIDSACRKGEISQKQKAELLALRSRALANNQANCEFKAKLTLALAQRLIDWEGSGWQLGLVCYRTHIVAVLFNKETEEVYDPEKRAPLPEIDAPVFYPQLFIEAFVRRQGKLSPIPGKDLLMNKYKKQIQMAGELDPRKTNTIFDFNIDVPLPNYRSSLTVSAQTSQSVSVPSLSQRLANISHGTLAELRSLSEKSWFNKWIFIGVALAFISGYTLYRNIKEWGIRQAACDLSTERKTDPFTFFRHPKTGSWDITPCPSPFIPSPLSVVSGRDGRLEEVENRLNRSLYPLRTEQSKTEELFRGSHLFRREEFNQYYSLTELDRAVQSDLYGKTNFAGYDGSRAPESLNDTLKDPNLYSLWKEKYGYKIKLRDRTLFLAQRIEDHLKDEQHKKSEKAGSCLYQDEIIELNRTLLELTYPDLCPTYPNFDPNAFVTLNKLKNGLIAPLERFDRQKGYRHIKRSANIPDRIEVWGRLEHLFQSEKGARKVARISDVQLDDFFLTLSSRERHFAYRNLEALAAERWGGKAFGSPDSEFKKGQDLATLHGNNGKNARTRDGSTSLPVKIRLGDISDILINGKYGPRGKKNVSGFRENIENGKNGNPNLSYDQPPSANELRPSGDQKEAAANPARQVIVNEGKERPADILWFNLVEPASNPASRPVERPFRPAEELAGKLAPQQEEKKRSLVAPRKVESDWFVGLVLRFIDRAEKYHPEDARSVEGLKMRLLALPEAQSILGEKYQPWRELFGETTTDPYCGFNLPKNIPLRHFHLACPGNENEVLRGYFYSEDITPAFMEELLKLSGDQQKEAMRRLTDRGMVVLHFYSKQFPPGSPKRVELDRLVREWVLAETRVTAQARERGFDNNHGVRGDNRFDIPKTDFALFGTEGDKIWESLKRNGSLEEYYFARPFLEGEELVLESSRLSPKDRKLLEKELQKFDMISGKQRFSIDQYKRYLADYILHVNDKSYQYDKDELRSAELLLRHWDELVKEGYLEKHGWLKDRRPISRLSPENQKIFRRILTKSLYLEWGDQILEAIESYDDYWREKFAILEFSAANAGQFRGLTDFNEKIFSILAPAKSDREWWKKRFDHPVDSLVRTNEYLKLTSLYDIWVKNGAEFKATSEEDARIIELAEITRDYRRFGFNSLPNHKKLLIMELNRLLLGLLAKTAEDDKKQ